MHIVLSKSLLIGKMLDSMSRNIIFSLGRMILIILPKDIYRRKEKKGRFMDNTAPTPQEIAAQLRILNRAQLNYKYAPGRDEKNEADSTFQACWDWFKLHRIALRQDESGSWEVDKSQQTGEQLS